MRKEWEFSFSRGNSRTYQNHRNIQQINQKWLKNAHSEFWYSKICEKFKSFLNGRQCKNCQVYKVPIWQEKGVLENCKSFKRIRKLPSAKQVCSQPQSSFANLALLALFLASQTNPPCHQATHHPTNPPSHTHWPSPTPYSFNCPDMWTPALLGYHSTSESLNYI